MPIDCFRHPFFSSSAPAAAGLGRDVAGDQGGLHGRRLRAPLRRRQGGHGAGRGGGRARRALDRSPQVIAPSVNPAQIGADGRSRGWGIVRFADAETASAAAAGVWHWCTALLVTPHAATLPSSLPFLPPSLRSPQWPGGAGPRHPGELGRAPEWRTLRQRLLLLPSPCLCRSARTRAAAPASRASRDVLPAQACREGPPPEHCHLQGRHTEAQSLRQALDLRAPISAAGSSTGTGGLPT